MRRRPNGLLRQPEAKERHVDASPSGIFEYFYRSARALVAPLVFLHRSCAAAHSSLAAAHSAAVAGLPTAVAALSPGAAALTTR